MSSLNRNIYLKKKIYDAYYAPRSSIDPKTNKPYWTYLELIDDNIDPIDSIRFKKVKVLIRTDDFDCSYKESISEETLHKIVFEIYPEQMTFLNYN